MPSPTAGQENSIMADDTRESLRRGAICVAGMHRSGTSMTTRIIQLLGADIGSEAELLPAAVSNLAGHWERESIVEVNDRVLALLDAAWDRPPDPAAVQIDWIARHPELVADARATVEPLTHAGRWVWKDPRTTLLLPFWRQVLGGAFPIVWCLRHPLDVADSLSARNNTSLQFGASLWMAYNRALDAATESDDALVVSMATLFDAPVATLSKLAAWLDLDADEAALVRAAATMDTRLWHGDQPDPDRVAMLSDDVLAYYEQLAARGETQLDGIARRTSRAMDPEHVARLMAETKVDRVELAELRDRVRQQEVAIAALEALREEHASRGEYITELEQRLARAEYLHERAVQENRFRGEELANVVATCDEWIERARVAEEALFSPRRRRLGWPRS